MSETIKNIDLKISDLKIVGKIGEGGMSVVYLAKQLSLKRDIAVKVMRFEIAGNNLDVQRFKHEASTIAQLNHPNIINIYSIGQTANGEMYFTMPYLNHGDFSSYVFVDDQKLIMLLKSICNGLDFAHNRGVIHRDIKPENLLFDEFGNIKIADFGIALSKDGNRITEEHHIVGSAEYMSPEQARSSKVDIHTDIYSLGIVIYEKLTDKVPFKSDDSISILVDHVSSEPAKLPAKFSHWQGLIDKCLSKSPTDRFQSVSELKIALEGISSQSKRFSRHSIKKIFTDATGKYLKWYISGIFIILIFILFQHEPYPLNDFVELTPEAIELDKNQADLSIEEIRENLQKQQLILSTVTAESSQLTQDDREINLLLSNAFENINDYLFLDSANSNVTDQFLQVLTLRPDNKEAIKGLEYIQDKYINIILLSLDKSNFMTALKHARLLNIFHNKVENSLADFQQQKDIIFTEILQIDIESTAITSIDARNLAKIVKILAFDNVFLRKLNEWVNIKLNPQIGEIFLTGSQIEKTYFADKNIAVSHEITVDNYAKFSDATKRSALKCIHQVGIISKISKMSRIKRINKIGNYFSSKNWAKPYFHQTSEHPVVCISYNDAQAYAKWLSQKTGYRYRLLSKTEWLFLASNKNNVFRACQSANIAGQESKKIRDKDNKYSCTDNYIFTAPIARFTKNKLGLFDIQGNVSEWINCNNHPCTTSTAMGSSWLDGMELNKLNKSVQYNANDAFSNIGFRLIRDLK